MPISPETKRIVDKLYKTIGTEDGYLFESLLNERCRVEEIVQATIEIYTKGEK